MDFHLFSQYLLSGIVIGIIYSLMVLGLTLIYGIMKMIYCWMGWIYISCRSVQYALAPCTNLRKPHTRQSYRLKVRYQW